MAHAVAQMKGTRRTTPERTTDATLYHIVIECVSPELEAGRYPVKRVVGDPVDVGADIFRDGHDLLAARIRYRGPDDADWRAAPLAHDFDSDRWYGMFEVDRAGRWTFTVEAWTDEFGSWRADMEKRLAAGQDVSSELLEAAEMIRGTAKKTRATDARRRLMDAAKTIADPAGEIQARIAAAMDPALLALVEEHWVPRDLTRYARELPITVDRERARFGAWYEMFPRSQGTIPGKHGTFADAAKRLPRLAELGFDVIYLPPIHPIGHTARKGPNNTLGAGPEDVGSPWAIGNEHGGHTAIDPHLGTMDDFEAFVGVAQDHGMEIALDYALQCSPDHPWLKEHPDWFFIRPDGTIKHAENPPKKYQDIVPINFWNPDRQALWDACRDILLFWIARGVRIFRVDNPHTKPFAFWEWVIGEVRAAHPDVIFLAEAFTRPKKMKDLAKLGFTQSYTYFTWKNTSWELRDYLTELTQTPMAEYFRGNLFANTPDILHEYLQTGGLPAFRVRLLLAATLLPSYGIYSGFELGENVPVKPGSEEYLNSEKYEIRVRDWEAPGNLNGEIQRLNRIRREQRALQLYTNLRFHPSDNDRILCYSKTVPDHGDDLLMIVNLDPHRTQETTVTVPLDLLGLGADVSYVVHDLPSGARYTWRGARNYVRLDPALQPGHLFRIERRG